MNRAGGGAFSLATGIAATGILLIAPSRDDDRDDIKPLLNGRDFQGGQARKPDLWSVKDGMISARRGKNHARRTG